MEFKIGQTVELVKTHGMIAKKGATAVVSKLYKGYGSSLIDVVWKTDFGSQHDGGYGKYRFKSLPRKNQQLLFVFMEQEDGK